MTGRESRKSHRPVQLTWKRIFSGSRTIAKAEKSLSETETAMPESVSLTSTRRLLTLPCRPLVILSMDYLAGWSSSSIILRFPAWLPQLPPSIFTLMVILLFQPYPHRSGIKLWGPSSRPVGSAGSMSCATSHRVQQAKGDAANGFDQIGHIQLQQGIRLLWLLNRKT